MMEQKMEEMKTNGGNSAFRAQQIIEEVIELEQSSVKRNKELDISAEFVTKIAKTLPFFSESQMTLQKFAQQLWVMQKTLENSHLHSVFSISQLQRLYSRDWKYLSHPQRDSLIANYTQNPYGTQQEMARLQSQIDQQIEIQ